MIRYVHIGSQINEDAEEFAFFDTVVNRFLDFDGVQVFTSKADFDEATAIEKFRAARERCLRLIPDPEDA